MDTDLQVNQLIKSGYHPYGKLDNLLDEFLQAALKEIHSSEGTIQIQNPEMAIAGQEEPELIISCVENIHNEPPEFFSDSDFVECPLYDQPPEEIEKPSAAHIGKYEESLLSFPLIYMGETIGKVSLKLNKQYSQTPKVRDFVDLFVKELAFFIKRHEVKQRTLEYLGRELFLIGTSPSLKKLDGFIEKASQVDLPVLIEGEFGCEKLHVACAIHFCSSRQQMPFIEVNCSSQHTSNFLKKLSSSFEEAEGGTLFLNGVDQLDLEYQAHIMEYLDSRVGQWVGAIPQKRDVRIIASSSLDLHQMVQEESFLKELLIELNFLKIDIPPLRERQEDIHAHIEYLVQKYQKIPGQRISEKILKICETYHWPENIFELERVIATLMALSGEQEVIDSDILEYDEKLKRFFDENEEQSLPCPKAQEENFGEGSRKNRRLMAIPVELLAQNLAKQNLQGLENFHPSLYKALKYVSEHFHEEISLSHLSQQAHISPSHLSFLFKTELGYPFKSFLAMVRIEKAKQLLETQSNQRITDISYDVGFGDLSHFEKTFKRIVGQNPRKYRQEVLYNRSPFFLQES